MPASVRDSPAACELLEQADDLLYVHGDLDGAIAIYRKVLKHFPDDPELLFQVGSAELTAGDIESARRRLSRSVRARPTPEAHRALAKVYDLYGDADAALAEIDRGLSLAPGDPTLLAARADALLVKNDVDGAHEILQPLLVADEVHPAVIVSFARLAHRVDRVADAARIIESSIDAAAPQQQAVLAFRLASLLERLGEFDRAFAAADRANRLRAYPFDPAAFTARIDESIRNWTRDAVTSIQRPTTDTSRPIFIVGMPRSGTSLAERIIGAHSRVRAGGELPCLPGIVLDVGAMPMSPPVLTSPAVLSRQVVARVSRRYLNDLRRIDKSAPRITDKMPTNFLNLGLVDAILPGAKVVHCIRDPRDTCLSCFFQSFSGGIPFAGDLAHLAAVQNAERRLMRHWKQTLEIPIQDLVYEDLVADLPTHARRLVDFLGLDWEDQCETYWQTDDVTATASIDQVRQPVYATSVGKWRHYEHRLAPLISALDPETMSETPTRGA